MEFKSANNWDVLIIGGGPSGLLVAIALRRISQLSVCVLEKSTHLRQRVGEILPPSIVEPLSTLGLWDSFIDTKPTESAGVSVWWGNNHRYDWDYIRVPYGRGWHIDRKSFEAMLERVSKALGVVVLRGWKVTNIEMNQNRPNHVKAHVKNGAINMFSAKYIIDARGRSPSRLGNNHSWVKVDHLVGLTRYYQQNHTQQSEPRLWVESGSRGWWYSAPLPNNLFIATYMTDSDCCNRPLSQCFHSSLEVTNITKHRICSNHESSQVIITPAHSGRIEHFVSGNLIAIGDAAYSTDPANGHGLLNAMHHAIAAAKAIVESSVGSGQSLSEYDVQLTEEWKEYLIGRARHYQAEVRWKSNLFWDRRIKAFENSSFHL
jgi:flavin-dependent dehydrogenase